MGRLTIDDLIRGNISASLAHSSTLSSVARFLLTLSTTMLTLLVPFCLVQTLTVSCRGSLKVAAVALFGCALSSLLEIALEICVSHSRVNRINDAIKEYQVTGWTPDELSDDKTELQMFLTIVALVALVAALCTLFSCVYQLLSAAP